MIKLALKHLRQIKIRSIILILTLTVSISSVLVFQTIKANITKTTINNSQESLALDIITVNPQPKNQSIASFFSQSDNKITESQVQKIKNLAKVEKIHLQNQYNNFSSLESEVFGVSFLTDTMVFGQDAEFLELSKTTWQSEKEPYPAVIPTKLLELYNLAIATPQNLPQLKEENLIGKKLKLYPNYSSFFPVNNKSDIIELEIVGFSNKIELIGITIPFEVVEKLNREHATPLNGYNQVAVKVDTQFIADVANEIEKIGLQTRYFLKEIKSINSKLSIVNNSLDLISSIIIFLAIVAIGSGFLISINEQKKHIGLLLAIGASKLQILMIYQVETLIIAFSGYLLGIVLSHVIVEFINNSFTKITEIEYLLGTSTNMAISPTLILTLGAFIFLILSLMSLLPAIKLLKLEPIELLKS